nr:hypothetical protein [Clostridium sp. YIM B02569]
MYDGTVSVIDNNTEDY